MKVFLPDKNRTIEFPDDATEDEITEYVNTYMPGPKPELPDWTMGKAFMGGVADTLNRNAAVRAMDTAEIKNVQGKTQSGAMPPENIWGQRQLTDMERASLMRQSQGNPETMASLMDYRAVREQGLRDAAAYVDPGEYKQPESFGGRVAHDLIRNAPYSLGSMAQSGLLTAALGPMGAIMGGLTSASDEGRTEQAEAYEELIKRGLSHEEALEKVKTLGLQNLGFLTATNSLENMLTFGGSRLFPKASALQKILGAVGGNFVLEGGEEVGQKLMSDAALGDKSKLEDLGYEGLIGGLSGALMGGGGSAISALANRNAQREAAPAPTQDTTISDESPQGEAPRTYTTKDKADLLRRARDEAERMSAAAEFEQTPEGEEVVTNALTQEDLRRFAELEEARKKKDFASLERLLGATPADETVQTEQTEEPPSIFDSDHTPTPAADTEQRANQDAAPTPAPIEEAEPTPAPVQDTAPQRTNFRAVYDRAAAKLGRTDHITMKALREAASELGVTDKAAFDALVAEASDGGYIDLGRDFTTGDDYDSVYQNDVAKFGTVTWRDDAPAADSAPKPAPAPIQEQPKRYDERGVANLRRGDKINTKTGEITYANGDIEKRDGTVVRKSRNKTFAEIMNKRTPEGRAAIKYYNEMKRQALDSGLDEGAAQEVGRRAVEERESGQRTLYQAAGQGQGGINVTPEQKSTGWTKYSGDANAQKLARAKNILSRIANKTFRTANGESVRFKSDTLKNLDHETLHFIAGGQGTINNISDKRLFALENLESTLESQNLHRSDNTGSDESYFYNRYSTPDGDMLHFVVTRKVAPGEYVIVTQYGDTGNTVNNKTQNLASGGNYQGRSVDSLYQKEETSLSTDNKASPDGAIAHGISAARGSDNIFSQTEVARSKNDTTTAEKNQAVSSRVTKQLTDLGLNKDYAESIGGLIDAGLGSFARREGMTTEEFYDDLGLKFETQDIGDGIRGRIVFSDGVSITFTPNADATTGIHEMGHLFNVLLERQAAKFTNDVHLQEDLRVMKDFVGASAEQGQLTDEQHEKLADGFIDYIKTDSAPSEGLKRVFDRLKAWLVDFYSAIRGNTRVKISEDMRGVFDRMLAADDSFDYTYGSENSAESVGNVREMFQKNKKAGASAATQPRKAAETWRTSVDDVLSGKTNPREHVKVMEETPAALRLAGAKDLPVYMDAGKITKILSDHSGMTAEIIKQIPEALAEPIAIFKSSTQADSLVAMLELRDQDGATVIVPFHLGAKQHGYEVNKMASAYGQSNSRTHVPRNQWFISQMTNGNLYYLDTTKSSQWLNRAGLHLPAGTTIENLSKSVPTEADLVNTPRTLFQKKTDAHALERDAKASKNPNIEAYRKTHDASNDTNFMDLINSPNVVAERHAKFKLFFNMAKTAMETQEKMRRDWQKEVDVIFGKPGFLGRKGGLISENQRDMFFNILLNGDVLSKVFTKEELIEQGADENMIEAYKRVRALYDEAHKRVSDQRKAHGKDEMAYREGYVPHIFHSWRLKSESGEIIGSYRTMNEAVKAAEAKSVTDPKAKLTVAPALDDFGGRAKVDAVTLGDMQYFKLVKNMEEQFSMTADEARAALEGAARMTGRSRMFKNALERKGVKGFDTDMEYTLRHYLNLSARYVAMDELKHRGINMFERTFGRFGNDHKQLARYTKNYLNDVLGVPSNMEETLNTWIRKSAINKYLPDWIADRPATVGANILATGVAHLKLGFLNVGSALMNLTQLNGTQAIIGAGPTIKGMAEALHPTAITRQIYEETGIEENITMENPGGYSRAGQARGLLAETSMLAFRLADGYVRKVTAIGAYRKGVSRGMSHEAAIEYAKKVNDDVNFDYSVADAPDFIRRSGPLGTLLFQFKKYPTKMMELAFPGYGKLKGMEQVKFWIPALALSGVFGLPGMELFKNQCQQLKRFLHIFSPRQFLICEEFMTQTTGMENHISSLSC
ncbi:hypothetical protein AGMMS50276_30170 [Synergistales bacterium]|nr:hypothetical protein AGMMS50276_30170 [Synergistales bacterium]